MKVSEQVPLTPQAWCRNPNGYVDHQRKLQFLVQWLESMNVPVELPEDTGGWDHGVDLIARSLRIDLKSFGLYGRGNSLTWKSTYYQGRRAPIYDGTETDWFVHAADDHPSLWYAAPTMCLRTSKYGYAPYYFKNEVVTLGQIFS